MCEVMSSAARLETWFFQVNQELGEIGGVFVSKQPSDTDMGAKEPKTDGGERERERDCSSQDAESKAVERIRGREVRGICLPLILDRTILLKGIFYGKVVNA